GLSTGQRRRVALARAICADRPLMLLDEPTEGVDHDAENAVVQALPIIRDGRTIVLVSHRRALLDECDRVLELPGIAGPTVDAPRPASTPPTPTVAPNPPGASRSGPTPGARATRPPRLLGPLRWTLSSAAPQGLRFAAALLLGSAALGCGVALTATSAWL